MIFVKLYFLHLFMFESRKNLTWNSNEDFQLLDQLGHKTSETVTNFWQSVDSGETLWNSVQGVKAQAVKFA